MKALRVSLVIALIVGAISLVGLSRNAYPADLGNSKDSAVKYDGGKVHKVEQEIDADRDKIIEETKLIKADRQKLKDAGKMPDKLKAAQIKEEMSQDIKNREDAIKGLKKGISDKKEERYYLMNGKQKDEPRRTRQGLK